MERRIVSFLADEIGEWVAVLDCLHHQHVRHQPPFRSNRWVESDGGRAARIATMLDCPLCDRCDLPDGLVVVRTTATWTETSVPKALLRDHRVASGTWGRLRIETGSLRFRAETVPPTDALVSAGETYPIPPDVEHHVSCDQPVRFVVEFLVPGT